MQFEFTRLLLPTPDDETKVTTTADDDDDDCSFFEEALDELSVATTLVTVNDGVQLMDFLADKSGNDLPDILFLDLNILFQDHCKSFWIHKKLLTMPKLLIQWRLF